MPSRCRRDAVQSRSLIRVFAVSALISLFLGVLPMSAQEGVGADDTEQIGMIREELGLGSEFPSPDEATLSGFGVPLSRVESEALNERMRLVAAAGPVREFVDGESRNFGGSYYEKSDDATILTIILTNQSTTSDISEIEARRPAGVAIRYVRAEHTLESLLSAQRDLREAYEAFGIVQTYVDVPENRLRVTIAPGNDADSVRAHVKVAFTVESGVPLQDVACPSSCSHYRGAST
jgi:hypothetical protein